MARKPKAPPPDWEEVFLCQARKIGLPEPKRQYIGIPGRKFAFDFLFTVSETYQGMDQSGRKFFSPGFMLVVEIEGGTWGRASRHTSPAGFAKDCEKYNLATSMGYEVYRFTSDKVESGQAINFIREVVIAKEHGLHDYPVWAPEPAD